MTKQGPGHYQDCATKKIREQPLSNERLVDELIKAVSRTHGPVGSCSSMGASPYLDQNVKTYAEEILRRLNKK